jgi:predicted TIM-barrel fold metal-dependent hydrolase
MVAAEVQKKTQVIDADAHVLESERTWDYLRPSEQRWRPVPITIPADPSIGRARRDAWVIDGKIRGFRFPTLTEAELEALGDRRGRDLKTTQHSREMGDVEMRVEHMDELGIDVQILYGTIFIEQITDRPEVDVALCRSWNRWMADIWKASNGRLRWVCTPPLLSIPDAIEEMQFSRENGAVGVLIRPYEGSRLMIDPYFYPVLAEAQRLDMAMATHISNADAIMIDMFRSRYPEGHAGVFFSAFHVPAMTACHALILSPISQMFPELRWGIVEANSMWVPFVVRDADERLRARGERVDEGVFKRQRIYVTCENDDDLPMVMRYISEDSLMIGTDYGHIDPSSNVNAIGEFLAKDDLTSAQKEKILYHNPRAFHGL